MLASCPASILNHFSNPLGIPFQFGLNSSRSSHPTADLPSHTIQTLNENEGLYMSVRHTLAALAWALGVSIRILGELAVTVRAIGTAARLPVSHLAGSW